MTMFRINFKRVFGLSLYLLAASISSNVFAQSQLDGEVPVEGISGYIFSPYAITVLLVLALIGQIVYRHWVRTSRGKESVTNIELPSVAVKKRYDRDEISKLLKASASSKKRGRTLEEAIKLTQLTQPNCAEYLTSPEHQAASDLPHGSSLDSQESDESALDLSGTVAETDVRSTIAATDHPEAPADDDSDTQ